MQRSLGFDICQLGLLRNFAILPQLAAVKIPLYSRNWTKACQDSYIIYLWKAVCAHNLIFHRVAGAFTGHPFIRPALKSVSSDKQGARRDKEAPDDRFVSTHFFLAWDKSTNYKVAAAETLIKTARKVGWWVRKIYTREHKVMRS